MSEPDDRRTFAYAQLTGDDENDLRMCKEITDYLDQHPELPPLAALTRDEPGSARTSLSDRPRFRAISRLLRRDDRLVVNSVDQLGRSMFDGIDQCSHLTFTRGIAVVVLHFGYPGPIDTSTESGPTLLKLSKWIADRQRESIGMATKRGLNNRRKRGLPVSKAPYGWRIEGQGDERRRVEVPHEQERLDLIWMLSEGRIGAQNIANLFNIAALNSPPADRERLFFRGGDLWKRHYIQKLINQMEAQGGRKKPSEENLLGLAELSRGTPQMAMA